MLVDEHFHRNFCLVELQRSLLVKPPSSIARVRRVINGGSFNGDTGMPSARNIEYFIPLVGCLSWELMELLYCLLFSCLCLLKFGASDYLPPLVTARLQSLATDLLISCAALHRVEAPLYFRGAKGNRWEWPFRFAVLLAMRMFGALPPIKS